MSTPRPQRGPALAAAVTEASAWLVLLHGPRRTPAAERGFQAWLAENALHREAFETATEVWMRQRGLVRTAAQIKFVLPGDSGRRSWAYLAWGGVAAAVLISSIFLFWVPQNNVVTGVGEQRNVTLADGTRVSLNTSTHLRIEYHKDKRRVQFDSGEALFDVAQQAERPFVVTVGRWDVRALGTSFLVSRDAQHTAVTLVDGKVVVTPRGSESGEDVLLSPGQQLTLGIVKEVQKLDKPALTKLMAWRQGYVQIDDMTLADAIAEMNRYSPVQLAVQGYDASRMRVSGVFRTGDARSFAQAVALTHGLQFRQEEGRIVLSGIPHEANEAYFDGRVHH